MIGIVGLGFVGGAMFKSFSEKGVSIVGYDKYKNGGIGSLKSILKCDIVFLCLPTLFNEQLKEYNKGPINEVCLELEKNHYKGVVVVKSTVEPETINKLSKNITIILIAHRLNTVKNCDIIFKFDKGQLVDQGSFNELFKNLK